MFRMRLRKPIDSFTFNPTKNSISQNFIEEQHGFFVVEITVV